MIYTLIGLLIFTFLICLSVLHKQRRKSKLASTIKENWAKVKTDNINISKLEWYAPSNSKKFHEIGNQTITDIDFYPLFAFVNRTTSKVGEQFLHHKLKTPTNSKEELTKLDEQITFFENNAKEREEAQVELSKLSSDDAYHIAVLLNKKLVHKPNWFQWLYIDVILLVVSGIASIQYPYFLLLTIIIAAFNITYLNYWNKRHILSLTKALTQLNLLINVSKKLSKQQLPFENGAVLTGVGIFAKFQRKIRILFINVNPRSPEDISQSLVYLFELFKSLFLIDIFTVFSLANAIENNQPHISSLFEYVGNIDSALSIASLRSSSVNTCKPIFTTEEKSISVKAITHPLIENCVPNNLHLLNKGLLLTGSNMSGKTTFLRTLSINALLAQTIYTCFADEYKAPFLKLFTSIRIEDDLFQRKSYFLEEVTIMGKLIEEADKTSSNLFIMDEVFKGTNTIERIAAAKSVLSYLNKNNLVFVATHDIELLEMLSKEYDLYHFTETIQEGKLIFDHKLKKGELKTKNAIKILELSNYPTEIINEATQISKNITTGKL